MNIFILIKLVLYYLFHFDISIATKIGDKRFCFYGESLSYCLPYIGNRDINKKDENVDEVIIAIHGILKDSNKMCNEVETGISIVRNASHTVIICPQFLTKTDSKKYALLDNILYWSFEGWDSGAYAKNAKEKISSLAIIDTLIKKVSNRNVFPNLKKITLIGFSAGGQFVQRYAVLTSIDDYLIKKNINITYIPISPSSYLYLDAARPEKYMPNSKACDGYNKYKYGLENVNHYYDSGSFDEVRHKYEFKHVIYVVGSSDNSRFNLFLDKSCSANMQGLSRKERMENYFNYLIKLYGKDVKKHQRTYLAKYADHHFSEKMLSGLEETK